MPRYKTVKMKAIAKNKILGALLTAIVMIVSLLAMNLTAPTAKAETVYYYGDVDMDGRVSLNDVTALLKHYVGSGKPIRNSTALKLADANMDGSIDLSDVTCALNIYTGKRPLFKLNGGGSELWKDSKILIAYFSMTGNTREAAKMLQKETGGDLYEIRPTKAYPTDPEELSMYVMRESAGDERPGIVQDIPDISKYDIICIGFPIWHGREPMIIRTFVDSVDLKGKTIAPFCTSNSTKLIAPRENLIKALPYSNVYTGMRFRNSDTDHEQTVKDYVAGKLEPEKRNPFI